ncbi:MAG: serine hydrolase domain-containing protein [Halioglobus sp.]
MKFFGKVVAGSALLILLLLVLLVSLQRAPVTNGNALGENAFPWWSHAGIQALFDYHVWNGTRSGFIAAFARDGETVYATSAGYADIENKVPMVLDTRIRIASMTKPITAVAAMILVEEGKLGLDDSLAQYIPVAASARVALSHQRNAGGEFDTAPVQQPILIRHLLMFASGVGGSNAISDNTDLDKLWQNQGVNAGVGSLEQRVDRALRLPLFEEPGTQWRYGGSADVLARVIEVVAQQPFTDFLQARIFAPLDMQHTEHLPPPDQQAELARIYTQNENGELVLVPERIAEAKDWTPGGGGLVSTVGDYMRFALMLANGGSYAGVKILQPETVANMTRPHLQSGVLASQGLEGLGWGLGLAVVVDEDATLTPDRTGDFWWAGYFGTLFFASPSTGLVGIVISQNEPGPYSDLPWMVFAAPAFAFASLE